jgi:hypothetical protein
MVAAPSLLDLSPPTNRGVAPRRKLELHGSCAPTAPKSCQRPARLCQPQIAHQPRPYRPLPSMAVAPLPSKISATKYRGCLPPMFPLLSPYLRTPHMPLPLSKFAAVRVHNCQRCSLQVWRHCAAAGDEEGTPLPPAGVPPLRILAHRRCSTVTCNSIQLETAANSLHIYSIIFSAFRSEADVVCLLAVEGCAALGRLLEPQDCVGPILSVIVNFS